MNTEVYSWRNLVDDVAAILEAWDDDVYDAYAVAQELNIRYSLTGYVHDPERVGLDAVPQGHFAAVAARHGVYGGNNA